MLFQATVLYSNIVILQVTNTNTNYYHYLLLLLYYYYYYCYYQPTLQSYSRSGSSPIFLEEKKGNHWNHLNMSPLRPPRLSSSPV